MPRTIEVDIAPWCPKDCPYFDISINRLYGNFEVMETYCVCSNSNYCNYAVNAYKKYLKTQEDDNGRGNED